MPLSLNNSKDIVANSVSVFKGNTVVDLLTLIPTTNLKVDTITAYSSTQVNVNDNLTVSGNLLVGTTNVMTEIGSKVKPSDLAWFAPKASAVFSGETTVPELRVNNIYADTAAEVKINDNLTITGALLVGTTNVSTALGELNTKAPKASPAFTGTLSCTGNVNVIGPSDHLQQVIQNTQQSGRTSIYLESKSGASAKEQGQIYTGGGEGLNLRTNTQHPIKFTTYKEDTTPFVTVIPSMQILANSTRDVEILAPLKVKGLNTIIDNSLTVGSATPVNEIAFHSMGDALITDNLTVNGNLTVDGFYRIKPWVALYVQSNVIQTSTAVGHVAISTMTRSGGNYIFTFSPAHPLGNNFQIFVTPRTTSGGSAFFVCTAKVETDSTAGTKFSVWCRNASNAIIDGDFWVHTVP